MKQKKLTLVLTLLMSMVSLNAIADFDKKKWYPSGPFLYHLDESNQCAQLARGESDGTPHTGIGGSVYFNNKSYTVTSIGDSALVGWLPFSASLLIQESIKTIGNYAFVHADFNDLTIQGATSIGNYAFSEISQLINIELPNSLKTIGEGAFQNSFREKKWDGTLPTVNIPNSVTSIGKLAFSGCVGLTSFTIPNSVTSIGHSIFSGCSRLASIVVNSSNTHYDSREECNAIIETATNKLIAGCKNTIIPNSVTSIGDYAFADCYGLTSITIPNSVTSIGDNAFSGCHFLTSINIPSSVTCIGDSAFAGCSGLTSITIPASVTSIGRNAFSGCSGLTTIVVESENTVYDSRNNCNAIINTSTKALVAGCKNTIIPNNVTSIGEGAFAGCSGLTSIIIPNSVTNIGSYAFSGCSGLTSITIPSSVTSIGEYAFQNCSGLSSITIPNSITSIGEYAFQGCNSLSSITIPNNITSIGEYAYDGCSGLTSITIPNSVTSIGKYAFRGCSGLTSITIPNSVTSIGEYAFRGCSGLNKVIVNDIASWCNISFTTYDSNPLEYADHLYSDEDTEIKDLIIPSGITGIGDYVFSGCSGLTSITIPNSVTSIGDYAFADCYGLTSITIPNSVTSIGDYTFLRCYGLTSITIPNSVTSIGSSTFSVCSGLTSITIPTSVTSIGSSAFSYCSGLTSITIPNSVTSIGEYAFQNCSGLTSITIPNSVTSIGECAFDGCSGLNKVIVNDIASWCNISFTYATSNPLYLAHHLYSNEDTEITELVIPKGVTSIGDIAFDGCSGLTSIIIPSSVTSIGECAFSGCSSLTSVTVLNPSPVALTQYVFSNRANATLYVPAGSKAAYQAADYWKEFNEIISMLGDANADGSVNVSDIVEMVNYILNNASSRFVKVAADMNEDGEVNVTDIVSLVAVIMSDGHANTRAAIVDEDTSSDYLTLNENGDNLLSLALHNQANYVASQFVVSLSDGLTLENISLNDKRGGNHVLVYSKESDNQYRVLVYSLNNSSFNGNDGELLNIKTSGKGNVSIDDIIFVTSGIKTRNFSSIGYGEGTTGIEKVETSETMDIYSIDGRLIRKQATNTNGLSKGIYIVNGKKCVVK